MVYIGATLLLGFAAVNTGNNLLYLLVAALLGIMCTTGVAGWLNVRGLTVQFLPPEELYAGMPATLRVRLTNRKRRLPSLLVQVMAFDSPVPFMQVPAGGQAETDVSVTFTTRGRHLLPQPWVASPFPAGFFVRRWPAGTPLELVVFPFPRSGTLTVPATTTRGSRFPTPGRGWDGDLRAIADYTGQEPAKLIHWRLTARHDRLLVRELEAAADTPLIIDLDAVPAAELEAALSRAVALINHCGRLQRPVGLIAGGVRHPPQSGRQHRLRLLREVALHGL